LTALSILHASKTFIDLVGKFNATNPKRFPLLVKFLRVFDAMLVLSKEAPCHLQSMSSLSFLKARWNVIQSGTDKKCIKLSIYINKLLYARLIKSNDGSIVTDIVNNSLTNSQDNDSI